MFTSSINTDKVCFVGYVRIFGTDVGYRKLKVLKNVGIEENSKEKKQR